MAELYVCSSRGPEGFEKEVVIKQIRPSLSSDPQFVRMFIDEARLASRLNHPNVVQVFDFDKHEDAYYLAMEYVRGQSLAEMRRRCKSRMAVFPSILVAHIGTEVARGLHYVHRLTENGCALGLVHRDVTPQNVLLSFDGAVKLADFGIATASDQLSAPGRLKGKLAYMSPEQSRGEHVDPRTDVFALGIVLWEMLTGGRLFEGKGDVAVLQAVRTRAIPPVARVNPDVPLDLDAVVMKALQRQPDLRYQTAHELERALAQCVRDHAQSFEDTDVGGFLRILFPEERSSGNAAARPVEGAYVAIPRERPPRTADLIQMGGNVRARRIPGRMALKVAVSAFALLAMVASPNLHLAPRPQAGFPANTVAENRPVDAPGSEQELPAPTAVPTSDLFTTLSRVGASGRELVPPATSVRATDASTTLSRLRATEREPLAEPLQTGHGTLVVKIAPWAFLSIDGRNRGEVSGIRRYRLTAGKHRLRLWHPRGSKEVEILLREGERLFEEYQVYSRPR